MGRERIVVELARGGCENWPLRRRTDEKIEVTADRGRWGEERAASLVRCRDETKTDGE